MFRDHPPRPTLPAPEGYNKIQMRHIQEYPYFPLMKLYEDWCDFADKLAQTHIGMAKEFARCKLLLRTTEILVEDGGDLGMSNMSLSSRTSTTRELQGLLKYILGPERAQNPVTAIERNELLRNSSGMNIQN